MTAQSTPPTEKIDVAGLVDTHVTNVDKLRAKLIENAAEKFGQAEIEQAALVKHLVPIHLLGVNPLVELIEDLQGSAGS